MSLKEWREILALASEADDIVLVTLVCATGSSYRRICSHGRHDLCTILIC